MIFLSHNHKDKHLVGPIAKRLAEIFGSQSIFYDSWSIQPGDSLVGKMSEGLQGCKFFFLFASENSNGSKMVEMEWKNALIKSTKGETKIIPVRLERSEIPHILKDTVFIDATAQPLETVIRQIVDVVNGQNIYKDNTTSSGFHNLLAFRKNTDNGTEIEFEAQQYMEPISRYLILIDNTKDEVEFSCPDESAYEAGFNENLKLDDGRRTNAIFLSVNRPTVPGFSFVALIKSKTERELRILGVLQAETKSSWRGVPLLQR